VQSISIMMFLEPFKAAARRGSCGIEIASARGEDSSFAGTCPSKRLEDIEVDLAKHFDGSLSAEEKETLRLCRQLRNKVLHIDFCAARGKLIILSLNNL
jgi:hypothetical protein